MCGVEWRVARRAIRRKWWYISFATTPCLAEAHVYEKRRFLTWVTEEGDLALPPLRVGSCGRSFFMIGCLLRRFLRHVFDCCGKYYLALGHGGHDYLIG